MKKISDAERLGLTPLIEKAKQSVIHASPHPAVIKDRQQRKWLEAHVDAYNVHGYQRVTLLVLEGSPPRGYVIVNYATQTVSAFDSTDILMEQLHKDETLTNDTS